jgi:hypothetical protein
MSFPAEIPPMTVPGARRRGRFAAPAPQAA